MDSNLIIGGLASAAPGLTVWIVALVLSIILSKRGGGKLERLLVVGSSLLLVRTLLSIPAPALISYWSPRSSLSNISAAGVVSGINLFLGFISLAGVICLLYAIWQKFNRETPTIN